VDAHNSLASTLQLLFAQATFFSIEHLPSSSHPQTLFEKRTRRLLTEFWGDANTRKGKRAQAQKEQGEARKKSARAQEHNTARRLLLHRIAAVLSLDL
jgi:ABC-type Fe3+/spermidine/putrescine transport system ATPase subunit